ncbi:MAG: site-specific integrase [Anaerolineae bacterium]
MTTQRRNLPAQSAIDSLATYNFVLALPGRASSAHTQRAYFRWVDAYLVAVGGLKPTTGLARLARMSALPVPLLQSVLTPPQFRAWLGSLAQQQHGKQGLTQARASVVTLASLLAEAGWLDDAIGFALSNVRAPRAEEGQRAGRWLSPEEIRMLMTAARRMATSDAQRMRNDVVMTMLCTMALRREEVSVLRWRDLSLQDGRAVLRVHGKGRKVALIDVPPTVLRALEAWRQVVAPGQPRPPAQLPLVVRLFKGGKPGKTALTPEGVWLLVHKAALEAGLGNVAPHDLRRSVAGALQASGVPVDTISRLLRHSNVAVTERYLSKLPQRNSGALLMSDLLELDDE